MNDRQHLFKAIVWGRDPSKVGERTTVIAEDLEDAERQLKQKFGDDVVFTLHNDGDADRTR